MLRLMKYGHLCKLDDSSDHMDLDNLLKVLSGDIPHKLQSLDHCAESVSPIFAHWIGVTLVII